MPVSKPEPGTAHNAEHSPYLSTNAEEQALGALEATAASLREAEKNPEQWKWAILLLHNAVQSFMVLALTGPTNWGALRDEEASARVEAEIAYRNAVAHGDKDAAEMANNQMLFGSASLAPFLTLYNPIKSEDWWMLKYVNSRSYDPRPTDDVCMKNLDSVRNELTHFVPMTRGFLLTQFPAMTETGLHVIAFLVHESGNIHWFDEQEERFEKAFHRAQATIKSIGSKYAGLPRPAKGLCGAPAE
jgi:hypothetical protein